MIKKIQFRCFSIKVEHFAKFKPFDSSYKLSSYYNGIWHDNSNNYEKFPCPTTGNKDFLYVPTTSSSDEHQKISEEMKKVPKSGLHNPFKNIHRYVQYGEISRKIAEALHNKDIFEHFIGLINTVIPKSQGQARGELTVTRSFFENFAGDNVRFLARGFSHPGDHTGQQSNGFRWPYGPVACINPFNFPMEIPLLQVFGALFMGNKPLLKCDSRVALPVEEFIRLAHVCGLPKEDLLLIHADGQNTEKILLESDLKMTMFTGSSKIANRLNNVLHGKIKIEDAGLDWKILGPDVSNVDYVAHFIDHDSYAFSGQKCSAESLLFVHNNWVKAGIYDKVKSITSKRTYKDLTISPILTWSNKRIQDHVETVLKIPGSTLLWGGRPCQEKNSVPECYGLYEPTAIKVSLSSFLKREYYHILTQELFGPFQIVVEYDDNNLNEVISIIEGLESKLTCGVVSNNPEFLNYILSHSSNGTTYAGIRARTTGAPQNHWFGPGGDPRGGGIGTPEAIKLVWSHHREIVMDSIIPSNIKLIQS